MAKKAWENDFQDNFEEDEPQEELQEEVKVEVKEEPKMAYAPANKRPFTVYRVQPDILLLVDEYEHGYNIPMTDEYRNAKAGDIVYV